MSDVVDDSNDMADLILRNKIAHTAAKAGDRELFPVGSCYYCDCPVANGLIFCDALCRDDYAAEQVAKARNGR